MSLWSAGYLLRGCAHARTNPHSTQTHRQPSTRTNKQHKCASHRHIRRSHAHAHTQTHAHTNTHTHTGGKDSGASLVESETNCSRNPSPGEQQCSKQTHLFTLIELFLLPVLEVGEQATQRQARSPPSDTTHRSSTLGVSGCNSGPTVRLESGGRVREPESGIDSSKTAVRLEV